MPYIESSKVAEMRKAIRKALPDFKISVTCNHYSSVDVRIMSGPIAEAAINVFWFKDHLGPDKEDRPDVIAVVETIIAEIFKVERPRELVYDGDYGSVPTFYYDIAFGRWDKPLYICTDPDAANKLRVKQEADRLTRFHEQEAQYAIWKQEREAKLVA